MKLVRAAKNYGNLISLDMMTLKIKKTEDGYMLTDDFKSAIITKIYDNDREVFHIYLDDGSCYEVSRFGEFGRFLNNYLRKEKLKKINGKS